MDFGVLDSVHLRNQTVHEHPLMNGVFPRYLGRANPGRALIHDNSLLAEIWRRQRRALPYGWRRQGIAFPDIEMAESPTLDASVIQEARAELRSHDLQFVLLHRRMRVSSGMICELLPSAGLERFLDETLGPPVVASRDVRLYRL